MTRASRAVYAVIRLARLGVRMRATPARLSRFSRFIDEPNEEGA